MEQLHQQAAADDERDQRFERPYLPLDHASPGLIRLIYGAAFLTLVVVFIGASWGWIAGGW